MKKALTLIMLLLLAFAVLTSCGSSEKPSDKEGTQTEASEENKEFVPEIIPGSQINPRQFVIDYMYKMAQIKWTPSKDIDFTQGENEIAKNLYYTKGVEYQGVIYVTGSRTMTNYEKFMDQLNENGEYTGPIDKKTAWGSHCSSAIRLAYDKIEKGLTFDYTAEMVPSTKNGTIIVGEYKVEDSFKTTDEIIEANNATTMYEAYTKLQPGDCILTCWGPTGHARMVVELKIEKSGAGKVNPSRSGVYCIEQTNTFDKDRTDGVKTTWYDRHFYSFADLYEAKYIPLTIKTLTETEFPDTEFTVKSFNSPETLTSGKLKGIVRSTYAKITSVTVDVQDKDGNVVATKEYENTNNDLLVFQFNSQAAPEGMDTLANGSYSCYITANTLYGSAKIAKVDFTVGE